MTSHELTIDEWNVIWRAVYAGDDAAAAKAILRHRADAVRGFIQDTSDEPETDWMFIHEMLGMEVPPGHD